MSAKDKLRLLRGEITGTLGSIRGMEEYHRRFREDFPPASSEKGYDLVILADILTDFYTCVETALVRIARSFENELDERRWHASLLDRMKVDVPNVRPRAIREDTYQRLHELMRFRHFRRYYFDRKYDRDRMSLLEKSFLESLPLVAADLESFARFLEELDAAVHVD